MSTNTPVVTQKITEEELKQALPKSIRQGVSAKLMQSLNRLINSPELSHNFKDNLLGFTTVMKEGRFKLTDYINAVRYVSYRLLGSTNIEAYTKTFPDRFNRMVAEGLSDKQISSYVAAYNKTKLVTMVYEQSMMPSYIVNADIHQKAINTLAELMLTAKSEKVRADAANALVGHLKPPEVRKFELNVKQTEDSSISELREATIALARQQRAMIEAGMKNAQEVAHEKIVGGNTYEHN